MWSLNNIISQGEEAKQRFTSVFTNENDSATNQDTTNNSEKTSGSSDAGAAGGGGGTSSGSDAVAASASSKDNMSAAPIDIDNGGRPTIVSIPPKRKSPTSKNKRSPSATTTRSVGPANFFGGLKENFSKPQNQEMFNTLKSSWGEVVTATKEVTKQAVQTIEQEQTRIQASFFKNGGRYKRDVSQSLDTESLKDAEVVYITDRLITMSHPAMQSAVDGDITPERKLAAIAHLLQKRHDGRYMVWNLSELEYDYSLLDDQVMTFEFPGMPSPPLGLLMKILLSIESWLKADDRNVAVMHCLTGRGRTSTVMAAFLCWVGEAGFATPNKALEYMAQCKKLALETLTIPSQRRYVSYFTNMLDGIRPSQPPLLLKRIIMSEAPKFEKYHVRKSADGDEIDNDNTSTTKEDEQWNGQVGCSPYLQIFKGGSLVFTTAASKSYNQGPDDLPFCFTKEGSITFPIETVVQGDILIRCRHLTRKGQRVSMFRAAMHTGYIPPKVLRLRKSEIDGACSDKRYNDDFFVDLVFEECSASMASKHLMSSPEKEGKETDNIHIPDETKANVQNEASKRRMMGTISGSEGSAVTVTASAYDSMLHRDSRFWDAISERRDQKNNQLAVDGVDVAGGDENVPSSFWGPTIGRRREFTEEKISKSSQDGSGSVDLSVASQKSAIAMQSFTIGGELDFTLDDKSEVKKSSEPDAPVTPKKDDLMDALMAIDDDDEDDDDDDDDDDVIVVEDQDEAPVINAHLSSEDTMTEEIVFEDEGPVDTAESSMTDTTAEKDTTAKSEEASTSTIGTEGKVATGTSTGTKTESTTKMDKSQASSEDLNLDDLNLDGDLDIGDDDNDDDQDFDFEDDEDIQDLEAFLTKATG